MIRRVTASFLVTLMPIKQIVVLKETYPKSLSKLVIPCGLVARIRRSHRRGRGSIPRTGVFFVTSPKLIFKKSKLGPTEI